MTEQKQHQHSSQPRDGGYTIIESLVAMIVVSVLMIAIAPVMAFSVATRVQARRTELATQAARTYIDALRTGAIAGPTPGPVGQGFPIPVINQNNNVADATAPTNSSKLYPLDMDGGGFSSTSSTDFYVQGVWRNRSDPPDPTKTGYELMVRVYRADSFAPGVTLKQNPKIEKKQSVVGGLGDKTIPVVEMTTQIPRTTGETSAYESLCARLEGTNGCK